MILALHLQANLSFANSLKNSHAHHDEEDFQTPTNLESVLK
ncbi:hypothetical protein SK137_1835 [Streptococcus mitis]|nr:hypothetical protein SK137_1835 [Streptococcus mitis]